MRRAPEKNVIVKAVYKRTRFLFSIRGCMIYNMQHGGANESTV